MKKNHAPRSFDDPIARCHVGIRGRAGTVRGALLELTGMLTGRRFRRANKLTHEEADVLSRVIRASGVAIRRLTVDTEDLRRMAAAAHHH